MEDEKSNSSFEYNETNQTLDLSKIDDKIKLTFDYEMNDIRLADDNDNKDAKLLYLDPEKSEFVELNTDNFFDKLIPLPKITPSKDPKKAKYDKSEYDEEFEESDEKSSDDVKKANVFKRIVSKQKRRYQDSTFDLDMSYITEKVIAMGYPSTGMETLYRNSLADITKLFSVRHNNDVKVYNLCLEKDRIYNKNLFPNSKVGLFPATDHNPPPIKLILEFCIDLCLYLTKNPKSVAAVHCKAGKGRTGVMICSYLVFSGLCQNCEKAFRYYARMRTKNNTGVTIPSQRRYIKYFEAFLKSYFYPPYYKIIPKIIRSQFSFLIDAKNYVKINNILESFQKERSYFISVNKFKLKGIRVGPLPKGKELKIKVCNFVESKFKIPKKTLTEGHLVDKDGNTYYEQYFIPEIIVTSDIKIMIKKDLNFYMWANLWYSTLEMIRIFNDQYGNSANKGEIKAIQDLRFSNLVGKKAVKRRKIQINNVFSESSQKKKPGEEILLYDKIQDLENNSDLNELIEEIEFNSAEEFDKNNMCIVLNSSEFDKFQEKKDYKEFQVIVYYSLLD
jgi:phosphatidylinositol-3,4,5-trisphosphate 3-phosphatase/dual-specificity protein phosphatase PTEN